jgi:sulfur carrier protein
MKITVSGQSKEYREGTTIKELLELEKVEAPLYVTVSLNEKFVPNAKVASTLLKEGDKVEFIYFMGGGR